MNSAKLRAVAELAYTINASYCIALDDPAFPPAPLWNDSPLSAHASIISGIEFILNNPGTSPADQHQAWLDSKAEAGWVYGEVKDEVAKTHPCMLPYDQLPNPQRIKDALFRTAVLAAVHLYDIASLTSKAETTDGADITIKVIGGAGSGKSLVGHQIGLMLEDTFGVRSRNISTDSYNERTRLECESVNLERTGISDRTFRIEEVQASLHGN